MVISYLFFCLLARDHAKLQFYSPAHLPGTESIPKFLDSPPKTEHTILGETSALLLETALLETTSTTLLSFYGKSFIEKFRSYQKRL
jgi:hypothetical protein